MADSWIGVGTVVSVNPARRELRVRCLDDGTAFSEPTEWAQVRPRAGAPLRCRVVGMRTTASGVIVSLAAGVTRDAVAGMKGAEVLLRENEVAAAPTDCRDPRAVVGYAVVDETDAVVGTVCDGFVTPAHGVLEVETVTGTRFLLPMVDETISGVDTERNVMTVRNLASHAVADAD